MASDLTGLLNMIYSGRGITLGMTPRGFPFAGYTLTGRSPPSQARKLEYDEMTPIIRTEVTDLEQLKKGNPALLIYDAIIGIPGNRVVASNGAQTRLLEICARNLPLYYEKTGHVFPVDVLVDAMNIPIDQNGIDITTYEPDAPNNTPRISGCIDQRFSGFHIVRKSPTTNSADVSVFTYKLEPGKARILTTYKGGNENPLLPFTGEPLDARIEDVSAREICESLYSAIGIGNPNDGYKVYRVAAAVMVMRGRGFEIARINRSERGE
jgi:IMP cyclohydrolase